MRSFFALAFVICFFGCSSGETPDTTKSDDGAGGVINIGDAGSEGSAGDLPACNFPPTTCASAADCSGVTCGNECQYADCIGGVCKTLPVPQNNTSCELGTFPPKVCDGTGRCAVKPPALGCIGSVTDGTPADGCDDFNPCTQDTIVDGVCRHAYAGVGTACGDPALAIGGKSMQCWASGSECCPTVLPLVCTGVGTQSECALGSVCLEGQCHIACDPQNPSSKPVDGGICTKTAGFTKCVEVTEGATTRFVCQ